MPVVHCPNCRKSINAPEGSVGRKANCPGCRKPFVIGGKTVELPVAGVFELEGGRIKAWRDYFDLATWSRQTGGA